MSEDFKCKPSPPPKYYPGYATGKNYNKLYKPTTTGLFWFFFFFQKNLIKY